MKISEKQIEEAILDYLQRSGIFCWKNPTGATKHVDKYGRERWMRYGKKGSSDIIGLLPGGRFLAIEVKSKSGILSPEQEEFLQQVNEKGGVGIVARSVDEVIEDFRALDIERQLTI